ncbi:DUF411 domain-containing protein [Microbulbifer salipaludis]|uniref:DUF411 domain-containing protein n=1 Tax=Microbulbifer salipaludis TaxID=187980 RepID=A0ABS3E918_9GAMM|nr:DUF411 domain-containing protein [Microbulbifer salipaludis]MBN8431549.1 DUF411 domain-containing protein [Microbulbifer salipaludis]
MLKLFERNGSYTFWRIAASLCVVAALAACSTTDTRQEQGADSEIVVYKSPFCLCCNDWITHLEQNAFTVSSENGLDTAAVKQQWGIHPSMQGCHTGVWNRQYVFEGHVPARLIRKFLANPPANSIGLAVPGMPQGSPGMYRGKNFAPYVVYAIQANGEYRFYEKVTAPEAS